MRIINRTTSTLNIFCNGVLIHTMRIMNRPTSKLNIFYDGVLIDTIDIDDTDLCRLLMADEDFPFSVQYKNNGIRYIIDKAYKGDSSHPYCNAKLLNKSLS